MTKPTIVSDPKVMLGKPVIAGTRITVELILDRLAAGETTGDLISAFPHISAEGIQAALKFAADVLRSDKVFPDEDKAA